MVVATDDDEEDSRAGGRRRRVGDIGALRNFSAQVPRRRRLGFDRRWRPRRAARRRSRLPGGMPRKAAAAAAGSADNAAPPPVVVAAAAAGKRRSSGAAASAAVALPSPLPEDVVSAMDAFGDNVGILARMEENLTIINNCSTFANIQNLDPIKVADGGVVAPFSPQDFKKAMERQGGGAAQQYHCGINVFWLDPNWMAMPGVPLQQRVISELADFFYSSSGPTMAQKATIYVAVQPEYDPLAHKGSLQRVSPPEYVFAIYEALRRRIENKEKGAATLATWKQLLTSWPATFRSVNNQVTPLLFSNASSLGIRWSARPSRG